jgi:mono/diheme cytochrome c family protein
LKFMVPTRRLVTRVLLCAGTILSVLSTAGLSVLSTAGLSVLSTAGSASADVVLERGAYLMRAVVACGNCHTPQGPGGPDTRRELAGGTPIVEPGAFKAIAPNITPHVGTGIGGWSDAEIERAIREGVRPDGRVLGPPMAFGLYRHIGAEDMAAIIAYLRSVAPVENTVEPSRYDIPLPPAWGPPVAHPVTAPSRDDKVAYGAYLAGPLAHCIECHSPPGPHGGPDIENQLGAGGFQFHGPWGVSTAPNITPTGLGDWTDEEIKRAITDGVSKDGRKLMPPMGYGYYAGMTTEDLDAIVAYLRSLPEK